MISYSNNNEVKLADNSYRYELEYTDDTELSVYYNKLVLSLYGNNELKFIDGNIYNLSNSNVRVMY